MGLCHWRAISYVIKLNFKFIFSGLMIRKIVVGVVCVEYSRSPLNQILNVCFLEWVHVFAKTPYREQFTETLHFKLRSSTYAFKKQIWRYLKYNRVFSGSSILNSLLSYIRNTTSVHQFKSLYIHVFFIFYLPVT